MVFSLPSSGVVPGTPGTQFFGWACWVFLSSWLPVVLTRYLVTFWLLGSQKQGNVFFEAFLWSSNRDSTVPTMKQAFTNTTNKKAAGKPLRLKANKHIQLPLCRYGTACMYKKECIYRHPTSTASSATLPSTSNQRICMAYIAGNCEYGKSCFDKHPSEAEAEELRETLKAKPCKYGENCRTENCLYEHPQPLLSSLNAYAEDFIPETIMNTVFPANVPTYSLNAKSKEQGGGKVDALQPQVERNKKRKIPVELWVNDFERPANVYYVKDALERFNLVNTTYSNDKFRKVLLLLKVRVIDLHYQTVNSFLTILDMTLPHIVPLIKSTSRQGDIEGIWIITGTGHHVAKNSHQKQSIDGEGVLFSHVKQYLESKQYTFEIGVDNAGQAGALYLTKG